MKKWGVENSRITEMDWWDTKIIKGIKNISHHKETVTKDHLIAFASPASPKNEG